MDISKAKCKPCEGGTKPFSAAEARKYMKFAKGWYLKGRSITSDRKFRDFKEAMSFVVKVGRIAESEGHHPDISIHDWNRVTMTLSTHAIKGLSINDFILASKINGIR